MAEPDKNHGSVAVDAAQSDLMAVEVEHHDLIESSSGRVTAP